MARERKTVGFDEVAERVLGSADRSGRRHGARAVIAWREVAGDMVVAHTRGFALREGGELVVFVDSAAWANQLSLLSSEFLDRLNTHLGEDAVRSLRFTVSRRVAIEAAWDAAQGADEDAGPDAGVEPVALDEQERRQAEYVADAVGDPELREVALRAMVRDLELKKGRRLSGRQRSIGAVAHTQETSQGHAAPDVADTPPDTGGETPS